MAVSVRVSNAPKLVRQMFVRVSDDPYRALRVWTRSGNAAKLAHSAFTPSVSSPTADVYQVGGSGGLTTPNVTAAGLYGVGAVSYSWARIAGSALITAGSPASATTNFGGGSGTNFFLNATFRCTMTDSAGQIVTADVDVSIERSDGS